MVRAGARGGGSGGGDGGGGVGGCQSWRAAGGAIMEGQRWLPLEANPEVSTAGIRSPGPSGSGGRPACARLL